MPSEKLKFGFVASKKIGNAVKRAKAKRLLRALVLLNENRFTTGKYVFVAKVDILKKEFNALKKDFKYAMKKIGIFFEDYK